MKKYFFWPILLIAVMAGGVDRAQGQPLSSRSIDSLAEKTLKI